MISCNFKGFHHPPSIEVDRLTSKELEELAKQRGGSGYSGGGSASASSASEMGSKTGRNASPFWKNRPDSSSQMADSLEQPDTLDLISDAHAHFSKRLSIQ